MHNKFEQNLQNQKHIIMKRNIIIPLLVVFFSAFTTTPPDDIKIVTKTGTYVLTPPEKCINSNCLNGTIRTAQLAGKAVEADVASASNEEKKLDRELKSASSAYEAAGVQYDTDKAPYDAKLAIYSTDVTNYNAQTTRTTAQKAALDSRKAVLDGERDVLLVKWNALQSQKTDLKAKQAETQRVKDLISEALEQLKKCKEYGERAIGVSKAKNWGTYRTMKDCFGSIQIIASIDMLNGQMEEMSAWAAKEWN